jgi:hypothetical protein
MATRYNYTGGIVTNGLVLNLDAAKVDSYPGIGTAWRDLSGNNNNGTLTNGPTFSGIGKQASIVFDGVDDSILVSNSSNFTVSEMTIGAWFISKKDIRNYITTKLTDSWYVGIGPGGTTSSKLSFFVEGTTGGWLQGPTTINQNQWYYGVCTFKSNISSIYINGILDTSATRTGFIPNGTADVYIGRRPDDGSYFWGNIAQTQIYNRALSATEVSQNFNALRGRYGI